MHIGAKIKELADNKAIKKEELALKLGMTSDNLYKIYSKEGINTKILCQISEILDVPITYFFEGDSEKNLNIGDNNTNIVGNKNKTSVSDTEVYKAKIKSLERELQLKDKIIQLLENK